MSIQRPSYVSIDENESEMQKQKNQSQQFACVHLQGVIENKLWRVWIHQERISNY